MKETNINAQNLKSSYYTNSNQNGFQDGLPPIEKSRRSSKQYSSSIGGKQFLDSETDGQITYNDEAPAKKITKSEKDLVLYGSSKITTNNELIKYLKKENEELSKLEDVLITNERTKSRNSLHDTSFSFQNRNLNLNNSFKSVNSNLSNGIGKVGADVGSSQYSNILGQKSPAYSTYKVDINDWRDKEDQLVEILGYGIVA